MSITPKRLRTLLGVDEPAISLVKTSIEDRGDHILERLTFRLEGKGEVRGLLTRPRTSSGLLPAILYGHSHGGRYDIGADELLWGREYLLRPLGPVLAAQGYVTLCIDMPIFGLRATETENATAKRLLWYGKSLIGEMLSDHAAALTYLSSRTDVDPARIGAFGMSMGCTLSYWLAAIDSRIAALAHLCCYCDYETLVALGGQDGHGMYLMVPGLLNQTSTGEIAGLIAPRPQLICVGEADALTPPLAIDRAFAETAALYAANDASDRLALLIESGIKHQETPAMRDAMLTFFRAWL
ncbi:dienelactone hydrolase family protein [Devosia rhodophyticola]|uniref:Dienelactone hydrolase family protein n=1 Tax=Devosia rhodophyticola TaxID=3026423 RepID=A0ABY7YZX9_9HYPH|nr:dienelactone hydrolase family protein [Devosia rhodophyticola]WDR06811.1 dienelactone hydrolase family protein [Devosia rhodophyticola]